MNIDQIGDLRAQAKISINPHSGCWEWTGAVGKDGYGQVRRDGRVQRSHRYIYERLVGPIGVNARQLDHLCRVRHCVNPKHLEPVTPQQNVRRGLAAITAPLPPELHQSLADLLEKVYQRGVLDGLRQALG